MICAPLASCQINEGDLAEDLLTFLEHDLEDGMGAR